MMNKEREVLLNLKDVKTYFPVKKGIMKKTVGYVKAVDGISIDIYKGETLGLVGESGCGKTTLGKSILQLIQATGGEMNYSFDGEMKNLRTLDKKSLDKARKRMQIVFQDPHSSLNPAFTIYQSISDPLKKFGVEKKADRRKIIGDLLESVNMRAEYMDRYPHEFSGGQRQRVGIARALSVNPELIVCDEAVSALDVSIQAQVLNLLKKLKEERNLTYIFITHDLSVVEYISDRIAVMYLGRIVELAEADELYHNKLHPYTQALLSAIFVAEPDRKTERIILEGDVPSPINPPSGCSFHPRCSYCMDVCKVDIPLLKKYEIDGTDHYVACHMVEQKKEGKYNGEI